ncbi:MAG: helix-turn-helix domain-containing protein [Dokdonella sp.]
MNYSHLSQGERYQIQTLLGLGISQRGIARRLLRSVSSISREIRRNRSVSEGHYEASSAHRRSAYRRCRPRFHGFRSSSGFLSPVNLRFLAARPVKHVVGPYTVMLFCNRYVITPQ